MKHNLFILLIVVINNLFITQLIDAQSLNNGDLENMIQDISVNNNVNKEELEDDFKELADYLQEPLNLNAANKEQLERFPFLNDSQIENLLSYIYLHGQMQTIYELQLVKDMDRKTIQYLINFVCVKPVNKESSILLISLLRRSLKYGRHEVITRMDIPLYKRKGYQHTYLGTAVYNSVKYGLHYKDNFYVGVTMEKDQGEPFGALYNKKGFDYYSPYLLIKNVGRLKAFALGNYKLSFGQGLVLGSDFILGKSAYITSFNIRNGVIKKHSSTNEYNYFHGSAISIDINKSWNASIFYSNCLMDGVIKNNYISSIDQTGLHRSAKEAKKKDAFNLQIFGTNVSYKHKTLRVGATGIYYFFNHPYEPSLQGYKKYNLHGQYFYNTSVDYAYRWHKFSVQGELARGKQGLATLNRIQYSLLTSYQLLLIHRYYSHDYWALYANAFGENGKVQNENGWYFATDISSLAHWRFFSSVDFVSFPWKKFRVSKPSKSFDGLVQVDYSPQHSISMFMRYRYKKKEYDVSGIKKKITLPTYHHQIRYKLSYKPKDFFYCCTWFDYNRFNMKGYNAVQGYQASQSFTWKLPSVPIRLDMQGTYFHTDDFNARVYVYEKGLLYTFYIPSYQGKGIRLSSNIRLDASQHWMMIGKIAQTTYYDRDEIGSGNNLIRGSKKADVQLQLRYKF